jgi:hypothetical protein
MNLLIFLGGHWDTNIIVYPWNPSIVLSNIISYAAKAARITSAYWELFEEYDARNMLGIDFKLCSEKQ